MCRLWKAMRALGFTIVLVACKPVPPAPTATSVSSPSVRPSPKLTSTSAATSKEAHAPTQPTPTTTTPMLSPAVDFIDGVSEVPEGQTLLVEYQQQASGEGDCGSFWYDELAPGYDFADGQLYGIIQGSTSNQSRVLVGHMEYRGSSGRGGWTSFVKAVDLLPGWIADGLTTLRAVNDQGAMVVEIDDQLFWIPSGSNWAWTLERQVGDCRMTERNTLTNLGLLRNEQIHLEYLDGGRIRRPFQPGPAQQPTPVAFPCEVYQPVGKTSWIWDIEIGDDGSVWVAANDGAARLNPKDETWRAFGQSEGLPAGDVRFVTSDADETAWLAFWDGLLFFFDGEQWGKFIDSEDMQGREVLGVSIAPDRSVWYATDNGVYQWNRKTDIWRHWTEADGLHENRIRDILFTPDGKVWFFNYGGVSYLAPATMSGGAETWWSRTDTRYGYNAATSTEDGKIWFGGGFFDASTQSWTDTVYRGFANEIAVDDRGGLWVATGNGVTYVPDPVNSLEEEWQHYTTSNGLGGNDVRSLAIEDSGTVWFGAENATVTRCTFTH